MTPEQTITKAYNVYWESRGASAYEKPGKSDKIKLKRPKPTTHYRNTGTVYVAPQHSDAKQTKSSKLDPDNLVITGLNAGYVIAAVDSLPSGYAALLNCFYNDHFSMKHWNAVVKNLIAMVAYDRGQIPKKVWDVIDCLARSAINEARSRLVVGKPTFKPKDLAIIVGYESPRKANWSRDFDPYWILMLSALIEANGEALTLVCCNQYYQKAYLN